MYFIEAHILHVLFTITARGDEISKNQVISHRKNGKIDEDATLGCPPSQ